MRLPASLRSPAVGLGDSGMGIPGARVVFAESSRWRGVGEGGQ